MTTGSGTTGYLGRRIILEPSGFSIFDDHLLLARIRWADVKEIVAGHEHFHPEPTLSLAFRISDGGEAFLLPQALGGFDALKQALPAALAGFNSDALDKPFGPLDKDEAKTAFGQVFHEATTLYGTPLPHAKWRFVDYLQPLCTEYGKSLPRRLLATFFGIGYLPGMAGTYASFAAALVALAFFSAGLSMATMIIITAFTTALSVFAGHGARVDFGNKDPRQFVLDEVAGQFIASMTLWLTWSMAEGSSLTSVWPWATSAVAFFWFRVADILKPPPARQAEGLPRGWGITMDDVVAGIMAFALTAGCQSLALRYFS
jgi:phosphatidylglycerophosphatase A